MAQHRNSIKSTGDGEEVNCLVCLKSVEQLSKKPIKLPTAFGGSSGAAFSKICELLQVPYSEIQNEWSFSGRSEEKFPFCSLCLTGFHSVLKLEQQLVDIRQKIQEKIDGIRDKIRESSSTTGGGVEDLKSVNFRTKALIYYDPSKSSAAATTVSNTSTSNRVSTSYSYSAEVPHPPPSTPSLSWTPYQPASNTTTLSSNLATQYTWHAPTSGATFLPGTVHIETKSEAISTTATSQQDNYNSQNYSNDNDYDDGGAEDNYYSEDDSDDEPTKVTRKTSTKSRRGKQTGSSSLLDSIFPNAVLSSRRSVTSNRAAQRQPEYFSPVTTDPEGRMVFEGITITAVPSKGYQCGECNALVGKDHSSIALRKTKIHIKGFHLGAYKCLLCSKNFTSNDILNQHHFHIHEQTEVPCAICGKPIQERNMRAHQYTHMNATEKKIAIQAGYKPQIHTGEKKLPCRVCGKLFDKPSKLKRHELAHVDAEFRKDYKCEYCDKSYTSGQAKREHIAQVHESLNARKRLCKVCGESIFAKSMSHHMKTHNKILHRCKVCEKGFCCPKRYKVHEDKCGRTKGVKREGLEFECDICFRLFETKRTMAEHRRAAHKSHWKLKVPVSLTEDVSVENPKEDYSLDDLNNEGIQHVEGNLFSYQLYELEKIEDGYQCRTCKEEIKGGKEEGMDLEELVKSHVKDRHMGSFRCNKCTKRMKSLFEVQAHLRSEHSNLRGYTCDICGRTAIPEKSFKEHLWQHRSFWEMAEAINAGEMVPRRYKKWEELLEEMGVEVNLTCIVCEKGGFDTLEGLYNHRRVEHPDAPVVKMKKSDKRPVGRPKKIRAPDECPDCGKTFDAAYKMRRHIEQVHSRKRKGTAGGGRRGGASSSKKQSKRRKIKVEAEEDDSGEDGEIDYLDTLEIKVESVSPINSEDEEDYFGGMGGSSSGGDDYQVEEKFRQGEDREEGNGLEEGKRRRSLRDRTSLRRRSSYKTVNYAEEEEDDVENEDSD